ncbi:MAG: hypothetical protein HOP19_15230 [Acidobacteria bacterium]|nr:hypothetical protein [Acidobacteriota bacterium]
MSTKLRRHKNEPAKTARSKRPPLLDDESWRVARKGERLYQTKLKAVLEQKHTGMFAAIEVDSGDYFLGTDLTEAFEQASAKHREKKFFFVRIGYRAAFKLRSPRSL